MSFLFPAFLFGALAVAIPIVLHLLRRDIAPEISFSAVRLLKRSPVEQSKRRRLRDLLLLAARVAGLLLLAASFARPYVAGGSADGTLHLVAIDRSFSMGGADRFARARDLARKAIREASAHDRVALIAFDDRADVLAAPGSRGDAEIALDALQPGFGTTRYASVITKAIEVADGAHARLLVITDLQQSGWEGEQSLIVPSALQVEIRDAGELPPNLTVVGVRLGKGRALVSLRNTGAARKSVLKSAVDGRSLPDVTFDVPATATIDMAIPVAAASGVLTVSIEDPGGIPADNSRYVILDPPARPRVLVVTGQPGTGFYLTRALAVASADDDDDVGFDARVGDGRALASLPAADLRAHAAIVVLSTRGMDRRARDTLAAFVRGGGGLLVAAAADVEPSVIAAVLSSPPPLSAVEHAGPGAVLSATDLRHPIFRPFGVLAANLGQVRFARAWRVQEDGWDVAARFSDGTPALLERREGQGRLVLFASDLDRRWNDFPLHPAFVPFTVETVRYVSGGRDPARDYLIGQAPAGVPPQPGVVRLPQDGRTIVLNVDSRESSAARISPSAFTGMLQRVEQAPAAVAVARAQQDEARQSYWQYGLLLMLGALVVESVAGRA